MGGFSRYGKKDQIFHGYPYQCHTATKIRVSNVTEIIVAMKRSCGPPQEGVDGGFPVVGHVGREYRTTIVRLAK